MESLVQITPWIVGRCSFYAVKRNGVCLPDEFIQRLKLSNEEHAEGLLNFLGIFSGAHQIRPMLLRPERPELGVYPLYNHKSIERMAYNPGRLLCSYVGEGSRVVLVGAGFVKEKDEPIQRNYHANREAEFLASVTTKLNQRIGAGEILVVGSELIPRLNDALDF